MDLSALQPFLKTKDDANHLIATVENLADNLFKGDFILSDFLSKNFPYDLKLAIEKTLVSSSINSDNKEELSKFFKNLLEEIGKLPLIHIILAKSPLEELVNSIHLWFYQNYKKTVLLDISIDNSIIAGAVLSFNGRAQDYSLSSKIEQMR